MFAGAKHSRRKAPEGFGSRMLTKQMFAGAKHSRRKAPEGFGSRMLTKQMIYHQIFRTIAFFLLLQGCQEKYDLDSCTELYAKAYRGHPNSAHKYKKHCVSKKLIPQFNCQTALEKLMLGADQKSLESAFGPHVMKCFTQRDLRNFQRPKK